MENDVTTEFFETTLSIFSTLVDKWYIKVQFKLRQYVTLVQSPFHFAWQYNERAKLCVTKWKTSTEYDGSLEYIYTSPDSALWLFYTLDESGTGIVLKQYRIGCRDERSLLFLTPNFSNFGKPMYSDVKITVYTCVICGFDFEIWYLTLTSTN